MICKECGDDLKHHALGLCKLCYRKQQYAKYYETHKDELKQHGVEYRKTHKEEIKEYVAANRDKRNEANRKYRRANGGKSATENKQCSLFLGVHIAERVLSRVFKDVKQMPPCHMGYDFICNKGKKIDVKSACTRTHHKQSDNWGFLIKRNKIADLFLCLAFDNREDLNPLHIWLIPGHIVNHLTNAVISKSTLSKWDEYKLDINKVATCCDSMKRNTHLRVQ